MEQDLSIRGIQTCVLMNVLGFQTNTFKTFSTISSDTGDSRYPLAPHEKPPFWTCGTFKICTAAGASSYKSLTNRMKRGISLADRKKINFMQKLLT